MNDKTQKSIMISLIVIGLMLVLFGLYFAIFTDAATKNGVDGILTIAGFIAVGLFISVPAKIYLTLLLMQDNDKKLGASPTKEND